MNPAQLFAHFEKIADAPDAIPRLRRFILDLAMRGKLVPQNPNDEPASDLLKRIMQRRAALIRRQAELPEMDHPEELGVVPANWSAVPLIALGTWAIGGGFPKNEQGLTVGPYFFLKVSDMNLPGNRKYITKANNFIDADTAQRLRVKIHPTDTIIFPKIGGAIATNKRRILVRPSAIDNNCLGMIFWPELDLEWSYLLLTTIDFTRFQAGTAMPALQQGVLERIPIAVPPLAEQRRIVARVEDLMALCDQFETTRAEREDRRDHLATSSLARLNSPDPDSFQDDARFALEMLPALTKRPDQIKQIRQTILNLAVRGKLVSQEPNDEPASELLKRIEEEKTRLAAAKSIKKERPLPSLGQNDQPFQVPAAWQWCRLRTLATILGDGIHGTPVYSENDVCFFINGNNLSNGKIVIRPNTKTVSIKEMERHRKPLSERSVLISINGTLGNIGLYNGETVILGKSACYFNLTDFTSKYYVKIVLESPYFTGYANASASRTTIQNLSLGAMSEFPFPIPPLAEQHRIVARVTEMMSLCDRLEASVRSGEERRSNLLTAILGEALRPAEERDEAA